MGVFHHSMNWFPGEGQIKEVQKRTGWILKEKAKLMPPVDECPLLFPLFHHECYYLEL